MASGSRCSTFDVSSLFVSGSMPAAAALKRIDAGAQKIVLVVAPDGVLQGVITDGDIRRWIISGHSLDEEIVHIMNRTPICLQQGYETNYARQLLVENRVECIPVLDATRRVVDLVRWVDLLDGEGAEAGSVECPVVIMAGGKGTRLAPVTHVLPKALVPVGDKSIVERIIDRFWGFGCREFFLTLNYKANLIRAYFSDLEREYSLEMVDEPQPLGTAGGLTLLRDRLRSTFVVSNCDILLDVNLAEFLAFHISTGNSVSLVASAKQFQIPYGVCRTTAGGRLTHIEEKPAHHLLVSTGVYLIEPHVLAEIPDGIEYHLTDLVNDLLEKGHGVGVYPISERSWMDMGQWDELRLMMERLQVE
jgi:dTDP-glucose pyrophosphorylase